MTVRGGYAPAMRWWQQAAIYQIYPRSFSDSNGDGVGDLRGIVDRLDHLAGSDSSLGVGAVWISPFYRSPMADFGYDVADYTDVDPIFGTLDDFDLLVREAHRRDLRVIVDWVPNHTSDQHPWFLESRSSRHNPKRDWYVWRDPAPDGGPPNNWESAFTAVGQAWTLDHATGQYYLHSFMPQQPDLDWENPEVEAAMHDVLRFWLRRGVDGFRIDVVHKLAKDPELRDNGPGLRHDEDWQPTIHDRLRGIRRVVEEFDDRMLVGEVYLKDLRRVVEYINTGDQLDLAHNFVFLDLPWDAEAMRASVDDFEQLAEQAAWPAWFLSNHDHPRVASRFADGTPGSGERRARVAAMLICTLRGTPFVYQGEELGLAGADIAPEAVVDVDGRDPERAPIPWEPPADAGDAAGFTTGTPWLPLPPDADRLAVSAQLRDPASTLQLVRRILALRAREPAFQGGAQRCIDCAPQVFAYTREHFLVALNFTADSVALEPRVPLGARAQIELSTHPARELGEVDPSELVLGPDEGVIARLSG
ncbi:MAG TPA: alpha-amylase family glycosyl hydrolase [Thermoleophilaceae bacterium]